MAIKYDTERELHLLLREKVKTAINSAASYLHFLSLWLVGKRNPAHLAYLLLISWNRWSCARPGLLVLQGAFVSGIGQDGVPVAEDSCAQKQYAKHDGGFLMEERGKKQSQAKTSSNVESGLHIQVFC